MKHPVFLVLALLIALGLGVVVGKNISGTQARTSRTYFNESKILDLRQQANVLNSLLKGDESKASEFLIGQLQSDLAYFETTASIRDETLNKPKLCDLLTSRVSGTVDAYAQKEPSQSEFATAHLRYLLKWCDQK
jgi:hypothetical protein